MTRDELLDAIDGLFAYDTGAVDSGIHDEALRALVVRQLEQMDDDDRRSIATELYGTYLRRFANGDTQRWLPAPPPKPS